MRFLASNEDLDVEVTLDNQSKQEIDTKVQDSGFENKLIQNVVEQTDLKQDQVISVNGKQTFEGEQSVSKV